MLLWAPHLGVDPTSLAYRACCARAESLAYTGVRGPALPLGRGQKRGSRRRQSAPAAAVGGRCCDGGGGGVFDWVGRSRRVEDTRAGVRVGLRFLPHNTAPSYVTTTRRHLAPARARWRRRW